MDDVHNNANTVHSKSMITDNFNGPGVAVSSVRVYVSVCADNYFQAE